MGICRQRPPTGRRSLAARLAVAAGGGADANRDQIWTASGRSMLSVLCSAAVSAAVSSPPSVPRTPPSQSLSAADTGTTSTPFHPLSLHPPVSERSRGDINAAIVLPLAPSQSQIQIGDGSPLLCLTSITSSPSSPKSSLTFHLSQYGSCASAFVSNLHHLHFTHPIPSPFRSTPLDHPSLSTFLSINAAISFSWCAYASSSTVATAVSTTYSFSPTSRSSSHHPEISTIQSACRLKGRLCQPCSTDAS